MPNLSTSQGISSGNDKLHQESRIQLRNLVLNDAAKLAELYPEKHLLAERICSRITSHSWQEYTIGDLIACAREVYYERNPKSHDIIQDNALAADFAIKVLPFSRGIEVSCSSNPAGLTEHEVRCAITWVGGKILGEMYDDQESIPLGWADSSPSIPLRALSKLEDVWWWHYSRHTDRWVNKVVSCSPWTCEEIAYLSDVLSRDELVAIAAIIYDEHKFSTNTTILHFLNLTAHHVKDFFFLAALLSKKHEIRDNELATQALAFLSLSRESFVHMKPTSTVALDYFRFNMHLALACMRSGPCNHMSVSAAIISLVHFENNKHIDDAREDMHPINETMMELGLLVLESELGLMGEQYLEAVAHRIHERTSM